MKLPPPKRLITKKTHPKVLGEYSEKETSPNQRWDFEYQDHIVIKDILDDFFNHHDFVMLESARSIYEKDPIDDIQAIVDLLVSSNCSARLTAAMKLLHYSMGSRH
jgi:hypothetical protein